MQISKEHLKILDIVVKMGMDNASRRFSKTIRRAALIELVKTEMVDISEATEEMNNDLREMVSSMLQLEGAFNGKLLFMIPLEGALSLQDFYTGQPQGTSKEYDEFTEGTVQEIGNILASSIGNSFALDLGSQLLPTPPQILCDFAGTIFTSLIFEEGMYNDKILLTETKFNIHKTEIDCYFFLLPEIGSLEVTLNKLEKSESFA
ncbi:MAG: CheY-P phosphatase CheC [Candidatus Scalindua arabica]|uniref:CheY-P phosphatase CheC n=1 Tax=Candidatus Scalindua arabica TaxID=1127984 RepID=A0A942A0X8_9BACT|nr:CheY-P phosphatase CheC [Candidatus Scalindua arabica]